MKTLPENISGTDECCGNCKFRADDKRARDIMTHLGRVPFKDYELACLRAPGNPTMNTFNWCSEWQSK